MEVTVIIQSKELSKEELQALIQGIRDCEQGSFRDKQLFIGIEARGLSRQEMNQVLASIKPAYKYGPIHLDLVPGERP